MNSPPLRDDQPRRLIAQALLRNPVYTRHVKEPTTRARLAIKCVHNTQHLSIVILILDHNCGIMVSYTEQLIAFCLKNTWQLTQLCLLCPAWLLFCTLNKTRVQASTTPHSAEDNNNNVACALEYSTLLKCIKGSIPLTARKSERICSSKADLIFSKNYTTRSGY